MANIEAYGDNFGVLQAYGDKIIGSGSTPSGNIEITENGSYDVTQYSVADVQVGSVLVDINPNKVNTGQIAGRLAIGSGSGGVNNYIPINGYKKIAVFKGSSDATKIRWVYSDGTESSDIATLSQNVWTSYYDIPSNAVCMKFTATYTSTSWCEVYYSLLA